MYIIKSDLRNAFKTYEGWTEIHKSKKQVTLVGLNDVVRFTTNEMLLNREHLPKGQRFVHFPRITWREINEHHVKAE
jgi:hypothetical protein